MLISTIRSLAGATALLLCLSAYAAVPDLSVSVRDPIADEYLLKPGAFVFTRTGPTDEPLYALLRLVGSDCSGPDEIAVPGVDYYVESVIMSDSAQTKSECYSEIVGALAIPAGASEVELRVIPMSDAELEGDERIVIELQPSDAYRIVGDGSATFYLADRNYDTWSARRIASEADRAQGADFDGDGLSNLVEYALLSDPADAGSRPDLQAQIVEIDGKRYLGLTFERMDESGDALAIEMEMRQPDGSWKPIAHQVAVNASNLDGSETVTYFAPELSIEQIGTVLVRLSIRYTPDPAASTE